MSQQPNHQVLVGEPAPEPPAKLEKSSSNISNVSKASVTGEENDTVPDLKRKPPAARNRSQTLDETSTLSSKKPSRAPGTAPTSDTLSKAKTQLEYEAYVVKKEDKSEVSAPKVQKNSKSRASSTSSKA